MKLTPKQKAFCDEYLKDLNATQAAMRSGYSKKTANEQGSRLLVNVNIQTKIQGLMKKRAERTEITQDKVLLELAMIAFSDLKNYLDINADTGAIMAKSFDEMPGNESRAIEAIKENRVIKEDADGKKVTVYDKIEFKLYNKLKALEMIGRHLGMFVDKFDVGDALKEILVKRIIQDKRPE